LPALSLRDRDAIVTEEGLIFRVFGYTHPPQAYICDVEYAPSTIFKSDNPKALRTGGQGVFYKFFEDEGWKLIEKRFPRYLIPHEMLRQKVIGVNQRDVQKVRKPRTELAKLVHREPRDQLVEAMQNVLRIVTQPSGLSTNDFGVFGSLLHGFDHPKFSDIDLIIYGSENIADLRESLAELYRTDSSQIRNEFETDQSIKQKNWRFLNITLKDYVRHQRRKLVYALFKDGRGGRIIKTEFEPVKDSQEITNDYNPRTRVLQRGWTKMLARVTQDTDAPFMPSVYGIEPLQVLTGGREALETKRVLSYLEEFRMQACKDETVCVEGNLEEVASPEGHFFQVVLTYCPRYYEQALKRSD
jgi:predicted nucleotidyltransferase